ncbi:hypothetical protein NC653_041878 [Populus alba x Populus x berolinensis]|uniref:Uncharacterized protein n=1 Tax=Populus alba x Populus x berolinensis TaxID=444605 RepID=A0AAD6LC25_9ROSI|nr:hypothetical protein NC653_041878 [Populus alba x Populus x berolinensis]
MHNYGQHVVERTLVDEDTPCPPRASPPSDILSQASQSQSGTFPVLLVEWGSPLQLSDLMAAWQSELLGV